MPKWLCSSFTPKRDCGEDATDGGFCEAVSLRGMWVEIFAAVVSSEFRDATGGVCEPNDAEVSGTTGGARRRCGEVKHASSRDATVVNLS